MRAKAIPLLENSIPYYIDQSLWHENVVFFFKYIYSDLHSNGVKLQNFTGKFGILLEALQCFVLK